MSVKRRVSGKRRVAGDIMNSVSRMRIFAGCENFHNLRNSQANFAPPVLEHLQQHKTKNYEKLSLINKEIYYIWKLKDINENPNLKIEIK